MGLLQIAAILRAHQVDISYIDCLDRFHPRSKTPVLQKRWGRGAYLKTRISRPAGLEDVPRYFSRYGIPPEWFREDLSNVPKPDAVMVTSLMTYWYPGVQEAIQQIRGMYPDTPILLGGIYASLCQDHAVKRSGADWVVPGPGEGRVLDLVADVTGVALTCSFDPDDLDTYPYPAFDLQHGISYVPILTSRGCPFACSYCASHYLNPRRMLRSPENVVEEIRYWHRTHAVRDFAFYDDALLVNADKHIIPILEGVIAAGLDIRCHTPNALHAREVTPEIAGLMAASGFETIRLGVETAEFESRDHLDRKITKDQFLRCIRTLTDAGFHENQIGAYILVGLPGQSIADVAETIQAVKSAGAMPIMAYYTPIPHTALWKEAVASSRYDLTWDPIFTNNAILPCQKEPFSWKTLKGLKALIADG
ncbi:MAG: B12-binding domain-containing radical SAM protein [Deltaproteobacteria bacterium]|nr:B12-binding domain-containing radical SAM protein [Deltaproteobacteria bacterium]